MDEQERKFVTWWREFDEEMYTPRTIAQKAWEACLEANKIEENEPKPSPTEMVRRLLEKGWRIEPTSCRDGGLYALIDTDDRMHGCLCHEIKSAYRKAFPPKKKIEVEVWYDPSGEHGELRQIPEGGISDDKALSFGWTKGIATFWIEEEQ